MKAVFLGKHKRSAVRALEHLVHGGWEVPAVVHPDADEELHPSQRLDLALERHGLRRAAYEELDVTGVDVAISYLFPRRIHEPVISGPRLGCLNFHPAPLPDMRGLGGFNVAIVEGWQEWGVSCHFVDEEFDTATW